MQQHFFTPKSQRDSDQVLCVVQNFSQDRIKLSVEKLDLCFIVFIVVQRDTVCNNASISLVKRENRKEQNIKNTLSLKNTNIFYPYFCRDCWIKTYDNLTICTALKAFGAAFLYSATSWNRKLGFNRTVIAPIPLSYHNKSWVVKNWINYATIKKCEKKVSTCGSSLLINANDSFELKSLKAVSKLIKISKVMLTFRAGTVSASARKKWNHWSDNAIFWKVQTSAVKCMCYECILCVFLTEHCKNCMQKQVKKYWHGLKKRQMIRLLCFDIFTKNMSLCTSQLHFLISDWHVNWWTKQTAF